MSDVTTIPTNPLREVRKARGLTQRELAEAVGCAESMISMIENGDRAPSLRLAGKLAVWANGALPETIWREVARCG